MNGKTALALILIMAVSTVGVCVVKPASAQSTSTPWWDLITPPAVPAFTVQPVSPPTVVNTTYSLDSGTGLIVAKTGFTNEYSAVNITIKNQHVSLPTNTQFYYNVQLKIHNSSGNWTAFWTAYSGYPTQSNSEYTVLSIPTGSSGIIGSTLAYYLSINFTHSVEIDFQVQALIGYIGPAGTNDFEGAYGAEFYGVTSAWSNTQTATLPANFPLSPTSTQSPTTTTPNSTAASNSQPMPFFLFEAMSVTVITVLLAIIVALLILMRKRKTPNVPSEVA